MAEASCVAIIPMLLWLCVLLLWRTAVPTLQTEYGGDVAALKNYWLHSPLVGIGFAGQLLRLFPNQYDDRASSRSPRGGFLSLL